MNLKAKVELPKRVRWFNIGIMTHETSEFRSLIGIGASKDGGIILSPNGKIPCSKWEYGFFNMPGKNSKCVAGGIDRPSVMTTIKAPKLHYHRSGWTSVELRGHTTESRRVKFTPIQEFSGEHAFSFTVDLPELLAPTQPKSGDLFIFAHGGIPTSVGVNGYIVNLRQIRNMDTVYRSDNSAIGLVHVGGLEVPLLDLSAHGLDFGIIIKFKFSFENQDSLRHFAKTRARLIALDRHSYSRQVSQLIGLWTPDDLPKSFLMISPEDLPNFKKKMRKGHSRDLFHITRDSTGVVSKEQILDLNQQYDKDSP